MNMNDINSKETKDTSNLERDKIRDLKSSFENTSLERKDHLSVQEADNQVERRIAGEGVVEEKLNKRQEISFGASGCAGYCAKVHDGTKVHGTYY